MKLKFKKDKLVKNTQVKDYICLNGKKLSEQTINDYAPFIPAWDEREELKEDSFLVRCVFPQNHLHNDDNFSMVISKGHTRNVVIACRSGCCNNFEILQYFLSRSVFQLFFFVPTLFYALKDSLKLVEESLITF